MPTKGYSKGKDAVPVPGERFREKPGTENLLAPTFDESTRSVTIGPEEAFPLLENDKYAHQRTVRNWHVLELAEAMRKGEFEQDTTLTIASIMERQFVIDGQHRLWAVVESGIPQRFVIVMKYPETEEELANIYHRLDIGLPRTFNDAFRAHDLPAKYDLAASEVSSFGTAVKDITLLFRGFNLRTNQGPSLLSKDRAYRLRMMEGYAPFAQDYYKAVRSANGSIRHVMRAGSVAGVALVTIREVGGDAREFWNRVAMNDREERLSGVWAAIRLFSEKDIKNYGPLWYSRAVAKCWNAFYDDQTIQVIRGVDTDKPIEIKGTAFTGKPEDSIVLPEVPVQVTHREYAEVVLTENQQEPAKSGGK